MPFRNGEQSIFVVELQAGGVTPLILRRVEYEDLMRGEYEEITCVTDKCRRFISKDGRVIGGDETYDAYVELIAGLDNAPGQSP